MKVGDTIVSRITFNDRLTSGKGYIIIDVDGDKNSLYSAIPSWTGKLIIILGDNDKEFRFYDRNLNNYFYTDNEVRRLKLERICNEGR